MSRLYVPLAILCICGLAQAADTEKKIARKDVPAPVMKAFTDAYPKATILGTNSEVEDGDHFFEIESKDGETRRDLLYKPTGELVEVEELVSASQLPAPISESVRKQYPKATIASAEKATARGKTQYEVVLKGAPKKSLLLMEDGSPAKK